MHWTALTFANLFATRRDFPGWLNAFGLAWRGPVFDLVSLLESSELPLVEVLQNGKTFLVGVRRGEPKSFVFEHDYGPQSRAELSAADQAKLERAAQSGQCLCFLCARLRASPAAKAGVPAAAATKSARKTTAAPTSDRATKSEKKAPASATKTATAKKTPANAKKTKTSKSVAARSKRAETKTATAPRSRTRRR